MVKHITARSFFIFNNSIIGPAHHVNSLKVIIKKVPAVYQHLK